jgi:hypothetical protein
MEVFTAVAMKGARLVVFDAMWFLKLPTFRRNVSPPSASEASERLTEVNVM